jgi:hypothetical protein
VRFSASTELELLGEQATGFDQGMSDDNLFERSRAEAKQQAWRRCRPREVGDRRLAPTWPNAADSSPTAARLRRLECHIAHPSMRQT